MDPYERTHLGDGAKEEKHKAGDVIIKQGDEGEGFYMISEGELLATQVKEGRQCFLTQGPARPLRSTTTNQEITLES
jgi:CRP-like cAMP-binding protein